MTSSKAIVLLILVTIFVVVAPRVWRYGFGVGQRHRVEAIRGMLLDDLTARGDLEIRSDHPREGQHQVRFAFRDAPLTVPDTVGRGATLDEALLDVHRQIPGRSAAR